MKHFILVLAVAVTGCSTTQHMPMSDLNYFKPDCSRKQEQLAWLKSQLPTDNEYFMSRMTTASLEGILISKANGSYEQRREVADRRVQNVIYAHIDYIQRYCPDPKVAQAGCVTVREDMRSGSAIGKRCTDGRNPNPYVNRWDPLVDK